MYLLVLHFNLCRSNEKRIIIISDYKFRYRLNVPPGGAVVTVNEEHDDTSSAVLLLLKENNYDRHTGLLNSTTNQYVRGIINENSSLITLNLERWKNLPNPEAQKELLRRKLYSLYGHGSFVYCDDFAL